MEIVGTLATILVVASFFMKKIKNLRILNFIGAFLFIVYGLSIGSTPVILTNGAIFFINFYHLMSDEYKRFYDENKKSHW